MCLEKLATQNSKRYNFLFWSVFREFVFRLVRGFAWQNSFEKPALLTVYVLGLLSKSKFRAIILSIFCGQVFRRQRVLHNITPPNKAPLGKNTLGDATRRALDAGDSARFTSIFLASSFSYSQAESSPTHLRVPRRKHAGQAAHRWAIICQCYCIRGEIKL